MKTLLSIATPQVTRKQVRVSLLYLSPSLPPSLSPISLATLSLPIPSLSPPPTLPPYPSPPSLLKDYNMHTATFPSLPFVLLPSMLKGIPIIHNINIQVRDALLPLINAHEDLLIEMRRFLYQLAPPPK